MKPAKLRLGGRVTLGEKIPPNFFQLSGNQDGAAKKNGQGLRPCTPTKGKALSYKALAMRKPRLLPASPVLFLLRLAERRRTGM